MRGRPNGKTVANLITDLQAQAPTSCLQQIPAIRGVGCQADQEQRSRPEARHGAIYVGLASRRVCCTAPGCPSKLVPGASGAIWWDEGRIVRTNFRE